MREPRETEQLNAGRLDPEVDPELVWEEKKPIKNITGTNNNI